MAVFASTSDPRELARRIMERVKRASVRAWELSSGHLRHTDLRCEGRVAFFTMTVTDGALKFAFVPAKNAPALDAAAYAYHHGRLTELLLGYFSDVVTRVQSTPFPGAVEASNL